MLPGGGRPNQDVTLFNQMSALCDLNDSAEDNSLHEQMRHRLEARGFEADADPYEIAPELPAQTVGRIADEHDEIML